MKSLIIAEKPSVAQDIARVLKVKKDGDVFENDRYVITAAAGHLVELFMPEDIDKKKYGFWTLKELPIIPEKFQVKGISEKRSKDRLDALKKQLKRKDIDEVLNACDAGREGELIFTYIYEFSKSKLPVKRVWMQSMTQDSILKAFASLRTSETMQGLQDAARSRSEADWLIGINGTRALTKRMFGRGKGVATVGRVQTPTLSIVFKRELEIRNFKPRTYWSILGQFAVDNGEYEGTYQKGAVNKEKDVHDKADRIWDGEAAKVLFEELEAVTSATVSDEKKRTRKASPRLYDLTSLQREANGRYGFSATRTLQLAQALYEKHKVLTYPRTSSQALPEDYIDTVKATLQKLGSPYNEFASQVLSESWVKPNKRIFNNAQITDHFAIIPTGEDPAKLSPEEEKIYDMVTRRFIGIFFPPAEFDETLRTTSIAAHTFQTKGKVLVKPGYLQVYGKTELDNQVPALSDADLTPPDGSPAAPGTHYAKPLQVDLKEDETKPPARYTEATLLSAMEGAGKLVDDEELAQAMKETGLGTPATRASTIEHLLREKYLERDARNLAPTMKAQNLFEFLEAVKVDDLTQPDLTGEWEHKLLQMEKGTLSRKDFMKGITDLTTRIVDNTKNFEEDEAAAPRTSIISPTDKQPMIELLRSYKSQDGEIVMYKTVGGRKFTETEIQTLLTERQIGPLDDFRSKAGKPFSAILRLDPMNKVKFDFGSGDSEDGEGEPIDVSNLPVLGVLKTTGSKVYELPNAYRCEQSIAGEGKEPFRLSRNMLGKTLDPANVKKLLEDGKTDLIQGFKSKRTGRLFDAFLTLKPGSKIGFEFPPRAAKKAAKKATKKVAKKVAKESDEE